MRERRVEAGGPVPEARIVRQVAQDDRGIGRRLVLDRRQRERAQLAVQAERVAVILGTAPLVPDVEVRIVPLPGRTLEAEPALSRRNVPVRAVRERRDAAVEEVAVVPGHGELAPGRVEPGGVAEDRHHESQREQHDAQRPDPAHDDVEQRRKQQHHAHRSRQGGSAQQGAGRGAGRRRGPAPPHQQRQRAHHQQHEQALGDDVLRDVDQVAVEQDRRGGRRREHRAGAEAAEQRVADACRDHPEQLLDRRSRRRCRVRATARAGTSDTRSGGSGLVAGQPSSRGT